MNNPYDVHSWSRLYREEALQEARVRHLAERARAGRSQPSLLERVGPVWRRLLMQLLHRARLAG